MFSMQIFSLTYVAYKTEFTKTYFIKIIENDKGGQEQNMR